MAFDFLGEMEVILECSQNGDVPKIPILIEEGDAIAGRPPELAWVILAGLIAVVDIFVDNVFLREPVEVFTDRRPVFRTRYSSSSSVTRCVGWPRTA